MIFYFPVKSIIYSMEIIGNNTENIAIRRTSTLKFIILTIVTLGLYWYVWLWKLITDINKLSDKRHIHRTIWFPILIFFGKLFRMVKYKGIEWRFSSKHSRFGMEYFTTLFSITNFEKH